MKQSLLAVQNVQDNMVVEMFVSLHNFGTRISCSTIVLQILLHQKRRGMKPAEETVKTSKKLNIEWHTQHYKLETVNINMPLVQEANIEIQLLKMLHTILFHNTPPKAPPERGRVDIKISGLESSDNLTLEKPPTKPS